MSFFSPYDLKSNDEMKTFKDEGDEDKSSSEVLISQVFPSFRPSLFHPSPWVNSWPTPLPHPWAHHPLTNSLPHRWHHMWPHPWPHPWPSSWSNSWPSLSNPHNFHHHISQTSSSQSVTCSSGPGCSSVSSSANHSLSPPNSPHSCKSILDNNSNGDIDLTDKSHVKKPLNAFMLFMKENRASVVSECTLKESAAINQILGKKWHALSKEEQVKYYEKAKAERQLHMQKYPGWTAKDNYAVNQKKKKKREKSEGEERANKKCRARFGLEHQTKWCNPCRRKKKCIRFLDNSDCNSEVSTS